MIQDNKNRNAFTYDNPALEIHPDDIEQNNPVDKENAKNKKIGVSSFPENNNFDENAKEKRHSVTVIARAGKGSSIKNIIESLKLENFPVTDQSSNTDKLKNAFALPPHGPVGVALSWILFTLVFWGALVSITGKEALVGGNLFSLLVVIILAQLGGNLVEKVKLPPLLGMLIVGVLLRSVPGLDIIGNNIDPKWSATIRKMALVTILTRAGLGLDPKALKALSLTVIRMGIVPNLVEMVVVAVVSHFLLSFPWLWSFMLGFIFAGVSPSVVVPCMLNLSDRRLGIDKGVPTLVIAGLSIDNALSISGIGVFLGIIFSEGSIVWQAFKGPVEVIVGIVWGIVMGIICWSIPSRFEKGYGKFRFFFLFAIGLLSVFGSQKLNFGGAGAMGCLTTSFVAGIGWRNQGWLDSKHPVKTNFNFLWSFYQPLLFGLIGTEIELSALEGSTVAWGLVTLVIGLVFRFFTCFAVVHGGTLNLKEKLFAAIAWLPKATIQAAFGSVALDMARSQNLEGEEETMAEVYGQQVLTLAVLAIVFAAPIGAIAIMLSAPKLLHQSKEEKDQVSEDPEGNVAAT